MPTVITTDGTETDRKDWGTGQPDLLAFIKA